MKKIKLLSIVFLAFFLFAPVTGFACSCVEPYSLTAPLEEKVKTSLNRSDAVFSGKVLAISIDRRRSSGNMKVKFRIDNVWKGELPAVVTIVTDANSGLCGYGFKKGKSYLVYASEKDKNNYGTNNCSRTQEIAYAKEELKILGQGKNPKKKILTSKINRSKNDSF